MEWARPVKNKVQCRAVVNKMMNKTYLTNRNKYSQAKTQLVL